MSIFEIIVRRRSIGKMTAERPTREQIERMLEAATHAPNHHRVQPWKFLVLAGSARVELGEVMAEALLARTGDAGSELGRALLEKERNKPLRSPVVIVVAAEYPRGAGRWRVRMSRLWLRRSRICCWLPRSRVWRPCGVPVMRPMTRASKRGSGLRRRTTSWRFSRWAMQR